MEDPAEVRGHQENMALVGASARMAETQNRMMERLAGLGAGQAAGPPPPLNSCCEAPVWGILAHSGRKPP